MPRAQIIPDKAIIAALEQSRGLVYQAAEMLGCSPFTIYERARRVPAVREAIDKQRGLLLNKAEEKLRKEIEGPGYNHKAVTFVLRTIGKDTYSFRSELTGPDGVPLNDNTQVFASNLEGMTDEQLRENGKRLATALLALTGKPNEPDYPYADYESESAE